MKKAFLFLILTSLIFGVFSCKKDEEAAKVIKIGLVTKVYKDNVINSEVQYNASNRPDKMLIYNANGLSDGYATYDFGSDTFVDKVTIYNEQGVLTSYTTYLYDTLKRLSSKKYFQIQSSTPKLLYSEAFLYNLKNQLYNFSVFDSTGIVSYFQEQVYDTLDDPIELKYFKSDNSYVGSLYFTYDTKPNAFAGYQKKLGIANPYNKHNITKITSSLTAVNGKVTFNLGNTSSIIALYTSSYQYDNNNLPIKEIRAYLSGVVESESYDYK